MKKLNILWIVMIKLTFFISSCAKEDSSSGNSGSSALQTCSGDYACSQFGDTASGSISVDNNTLTGTYATLCNTQAVSSWVAAGIAPSDAKGIGGVFVVTSNNSAVSELIFFSDDSCTSASYMISTALSNIAIGNASGSDHQFTANEGEIKIMVGNSTAKTWLESQNSNSVSFTIGEPFSMGTSNDNQYGLLNVSDNGTIKYEVSASAYPNMISSDPYIKQ